MVAWAGVRVLQSDAVTPSDAMVEHHTQPVGCVKRQLVIYMWSVAVMFFPVKRPVSLTDEQVKQVHWCLLFLDADTVLKVDACRSHSLV